MVTILRCLVLNAYRESFNAYRESLKPHMGGSFKVGNMYLRT